MEEDKHVWEVGDRVIHRKAGGWPGVAELIRSPYVSLNGEPQWEVRMLSGGERFVWSECNLLPEPPLEALTRTLEDKDV